MRALKYREMEKFNFLRSTIHPFLWWLCLWGLLVGVGDGLGGARDMGVAGADFCPSWDKGGRQGQSPFCLELWGV